MPRRALLVVAFGAACGGRAAAPAPVASPSPAPPPTPVQPEARPAPPATGFQVPIEYHKLDNGLRVVISPSALPTVSVGIYYRIGFRIEPKDRTGFAHLFEHMMFQGSTNLAKAEIFKLVEGNGGWINGSTRFDYTNYIEVAPAGALELLLWAEADRMGGLSVTEENLKNQQAVVSNEVRVNVLNRPYGGFPWIPMPMAANTNWYNAHNFYGDLSHIEAATLDDVKSFFATYYVPSNAVVAISGDVDPAQALAWVKKYFGPLPSRPRPNLPDISEPPQKEERRKVVSDPQAPRPALAFAYHVPPRRTPEHLAMAAIQEILASGHDSLLHEALVLRSGYTAEVSSAINDLGTPYNYEGPMLMTVWLFHDADKKPDDILAAVDEEVKKLTDGPLDAAVVERAKVKLRSGLYDIFEASDGIGRVDALAAYALYDDDPRLLNRLEADLQAITPEIVQRTARQYLAKTNRTVLIVEPSRKP